MLLSAVSVLVVAQSSSEIPEGLMNNTVYTRTNTTFFTRTKNSNCSYVGEELLYVRDRPYDSSE